MYFSFEVPLEDGDDDATGGADGGGSGAVMNRNALS